MPRRACLNKNRSCSLLDSGWKDSLGNHWEHTMEMNNIVAKDTGIEDDPSIADLPKCTDLPCSFNKEPIRFYFCQADEWLYGMTLNEMFLTYYCMRNFLPTCGYQCDYPMVILLISHDHFVGGVYDRGILIDSCEVEKFTKPAQGLSLIDLVNAQIRKWPINRANGVLVRCSQEQRDQLTGLIPQFTTHIPFKTARPSLNELDRVFKKLTTVKKFNNLDEAKEEYRHYKKNLVLVGTQALDIVPRPFTKSKLEKAEFKQKFPEISLKLRQKLHGLLLAEDFDGFISTLERTLSKEKVADYLSTCELDLNGDNVLHFATKKNMCDAVKIMLELGCDPTVRNQDNQTPYGCSIDNEMKRIFIDYRNQNPQQWVWTKTGIPTSLPFTKQVLNAGEEFGYSPKNVRRRERRDKKRQIKEQLQDF